MERILKISILYKVLRIIIGLLFILNVVGIFLVNDDSQQSRLAFNAFQTFAFLLVSTIPSVIEKKGNLNIPDFMEVIFIIMCICHFIFGEMLEFFKHVSWWDSLLHTFSGSMVAILGFSLVNSLNIENKTMNIPPIFVAIFAICFSVTIGVLWEIVEFLIDYLTGSNMQRYRHSITNVDFVGRKALLDTMKDLILDTIGACIISIIGYLDLKKQKTAFKRWTIKKRTNQIESNT
jgi:uncharacterized membrane protein YjdF